MPFRSLALAFMLLLPAAARADAGLADDAGDRTPDASVGMGGAEMMTQEANETRPNGPCSLSRDCERGFACVNGRCSYVGFRQAEQGCTAAPGVALLSLGVLLALARRTVKKQQKPLR